MKPSRYFRFFKWLLTRALHVYFSKIEIIGEQNVPQKGPFILACNHQNAFLDAIVVGALIPRYLHFLTRSDVFNKRSEYWLRKFQMMPIYRIRDGFGELGKNKEVFDQCTEIFKHGESILIFSEGMHHGNYYLKKPTKGTARIALDSINKLDDDLKIIPCGLNYFSHRQPRNKVIMVYGEPISVGEFKETYASDAQDGLRQLTNRLGEGMKACLVIPENSEDYETKVRRVFNLKNEVLSLAKLRELASRDYSNDQARFIKPKKPNPQALWWASLPNWGPLWLLRIVLEEFEDKVFWASMKFALMMVLMPLWWLIGFMIAYFIAGFWEGVVVVFLSVLGLFIRAELRKYL